MRQASRISVRSSAAMSATEAWADASFHYLLPLGAGVVPVHTYTLDRGVLSEGSTWRGVWNPLESGRTHLGLDPFRFPPDDEIRRGARIEGDLLDGRGLLAVEDVEPRRHGQLVATFPAKVLDGDKSVRILVRERSDQDAVHQREDRGVDADPEGKREYRDRREGGTAEQAAHREAKIVQ